ncbi:MAG TPA: monovalent cation:proton antiporter-2 (CPA2) family protein [Steroidobacteraceae bacterium]|nr:monovalent cation:proton antiporter-2 (CPA2) family protein [Steroidobacteraceae bacterium]
MAVEGHANELVRVVVLLAAGVVAVPLFKRLGLGSVLGYLAAGLVIGPFGLALFADPQSILRVAELGVVMFLFIIGLEMQPSRLWKLRRAIFGLGVAQVVACGLALTVVGLLAGFPLPVSFIGAMGFVLSSTAIVMQIMEERGVVSTPRGQQIVAILLLEDLAIVPLLVVVAIMAPQSTASDVPRWNSIAIGLAAMAGLVVAGRYLLSPMFRVLAASRAREVMTAAALLVVLGAALLMELGGLSMAMGAFLAGVLLSESTFRHQLEADIEPFRGILLGLFFMSVGMSLDLSLFAAHWRLIVTGVIVLMAVKAAAVYLIARLTHSSHREAMLRAAALAQGGEFAFVLYAAATAADILPGEINAVLTAIVILSMAVTPLGLLAALWLLPKQTSSMEGVEPAAALTGSVLIIGFGRFGQVASQALLARGVDVAIIDTDTDMIRTAWTFGFKIYYGDGTRLDVLRSSGAEHARAIAVCVDDAATADRIVAVVKAGFPSARLLVRSFDRVHSLRLIAAGVDFQIRETFESALVFSEAALAAVDVPADEAAEIVAEIRRRDAARLELETVGGVEAGRDLLLGNVPVPRPLTPPTRAGQALSPETAAVTSNDDA